MVKEAFSHGHVPTLIFGAAAFAIMSGLRRTWPRVPNVLVAVVLTTVVSWAIGFEKKQQVALAQIADQEARSAIEKFGSGRSPYEGEKIVWRGDRIVWLLAHGFQDWLLSELAHGRAVFPRWRSGGAA